MELIKVKVKLNKDKVNIPSEVFNYYCRNEKY